MAATEAQWDRARKGDEAEILSFLAPREELSVFLSSRFKTQGIPPRRIWPRSSLFVLRSEGPAIAGIVAAQAPGSCYALLDGGLKRANDPSLSRALLGMRQPVSSIVGTQEVAAFLKAVLGQEARAERDYFLMCLRSPPAGDFPFPPGVKARRALGEDCDRLFPLQAAYEAEEVLLEGDLFDPEASRAHLGKLLEREAIYLCEEGGRPVAKAGTNARGFAWDQLGGVYTLPERRGRGLSTALCARLARDILAEGRKACLFVKRGNAAAIRVYEKLGFRPVDSYKISYLR